MKIMLDECIDDEDIRQALDSDRKLSVRMTKDCGYVKGTSDDVLVKATKKLKRLLVTKNHHDIDERRYPPCQHGGIIVFREQELTPEFVLPRMKAFRYLRLESIAKGHFTTIYQQYIEIKTHTETIVRRFDEHKTLRVLLKL